MAYRSYASASPAGSPATMAATTSGSSMWFNRSSAAHPDQPERGITPVRIGNKSVSAGRRRSGSSAGEDVVRVVQDHRAGDPVVQRLVLTARDEQHERGEQGDYPEDVIDGAAGDLTQRHEPEAGHPVGLRPPGPHPEHLQRRSLPVAPDDQAPDDVADAERGDGQ